MVGVDFYVLDDPVSGKTKDFCKTVLQFRWDIHPDGEGMLLKLANRPVPTLYVEGIAGSSRNGIKVKTDNVGCSLKAVKAGDLVRKLELKKHAYLTTDPYSRAALAYLKARNPLQEVVLYWY